MKTLLFFIWLVPFIYNGWDAINEKASLQEWITIILWPVFRPISLLTDIFTKKDVLLLFAMFLLCLVACYVSMVAYNVQLYSK